MDTNKLKARHERKQAKLDAITDEILQALPHGSGIDYTWNITPHNRLKDHFYASNAYHAMDENGMYYRVYDFTALVRYNGHGQFQDCQYCKGKGKRSLSEMQQYHPDKTFAFLHDWLKTNNAEFVDYETFVCNVCQGKGKLAIHPFELIKVNFHGQKERSESWGLFDYIDEYISEVLSLTE